MAYFPIPDQIHFDHSGTEVEQDFIASVRLCLGRDKAKHSIKSTAGTYLDLKQGTDAIIDGMRVDITQNFSAKDHMPLVMDSGVYGTCGQNFQIGIRTGNNHKDYTEFERPVVVIGLDITPRDYRQNDEIIMANLTNHGLELFEKCRNAYCDFISMDKNTNLHLNPHLTSREARQISQNPELTARIAMQADSTDKTHEDRIRELETRFSIDTDDDPFYDIEIKDNEFALS